jgi:hypothetical protein
MDGLGGVVIVLCSSMSVGFLLYRIPGGGKCPEEEHTTCSGGADNKLSQARFMGREKIIIFCKKKI